MGISCCRVQRLLMVTLLSLILLAGFPGTVVAIKPRAGNFQVPESFRQLDAKVVSLRFYASETSKWVPSSARAYKTDFIRTDTHYIWWELLLDTKAKRDKPVSLFVKAIWKYPDGTEVRQSKTLNVPANFQRPGISGCQGSTKPESWLPGVYRVLILIDDIPVARGNIEVFEKLLKRE